LLCMMICTEIPRFARNNKKLLRSYVRIDQANHSFLRYDSWVDCNDTKDEYTLQRLIDAHAQDPNCYVGEISIEVLRKIQGGVQTSPKLERRKKSSINSALAKQINEHHG